MIEGKFVGEKSKSLELALCYPYCSIYLMIDLFHASALDLYYPGSTDPTSITATLLAINLCFFDAYGFASPKVIHFKLTNMSRNTRTRTNQTGFDRYFIV